jgi:hypothetical protein
MEYKKEKLLLEEKPRRSRKENDRLKFITDEMVTLQQFLDDANEQRQQIKSEIGVLFNKYHSLFVIDC